MKGIDEYTKEELYAELTAQLAKSECLQQEVERLYSIVMKSLDKAKSESTSKTDVRINM